LFDGKAQYNKNGLFYDDVNSKYSEFSHLFWNTRNSDSEHKRDKSKFILWSGKHKYLLPFT